jgi:predicted aconitase
MSGRGSKMGSAPACLRASTHRQISGAAAGVAPTAGRGGTPERQGHPPARNIRREDVEADTVIDAIETVHARLTSPRLVIPPTPQQELAHIAGHADTAAERDRALAVNAARAIAPC